MKKILVVMCLCLLTLCFLVACENKNSQSQNNVDQNPTEETSNNTSEKDDIFSDYQDILDTISLLHSQGDAFDASKYTDLDERESAIYNSLSHFICGGSSYCIKDINNDGVVELIMLTEAWELKGLFTLKDGLPILIEKCDNGGIGKDGKIRAEFIEETSEYKKTAFSLKTLDDHTLLSEIELEETDFYDDAKKDEHYQIIDGKRFEKNYYDFVNLKIEYSFRDYHNLTPSAGIFYTRLLDIPVLRYKGKYYSMSSLSNSKGVYTYFLEVYDKDGNTVLSCDGYDLSAYEIEVNDHETVVSIFYGKGVYKYYSVTNDLFSNEFRNVLDTNGVLVAYSSGEGAAKRLVVQDIFDESRFYKCYDHEAVKNGTTTVRFGQDGKSINLEYRLNDAKNGTTRVLCLEMLPILKTKKICYIRFEPSILSECYMKSSGVRAVLRADTHDTVRLLSDGAIIGGEYESDDGTVRNDWYCIDYRGDIYYVTADSFEMDYQLDIPVDETAPYDFISEQERLSWKDKVITALSVANPYGEIEPGILGAALMDLNFDNTPELIVVGSGGSMGNVYIAAYNIESGEKMCHLLYTPHYGDWNNVYFCLHRNNDGNYILINEGSLRDGLEWYTITSKLTEDFKFDTIFEEVKSSDDDIQYYCDGKEVNKAEFEKQKSQLKGYEISETQMKIIYWEDIDTETKSAAISAMAEALVNSEQQFIDFDVDKEVLADYKNVYIELLKGKKDSFRSFSLVFIDDDDIPELYISGLCEAEGDMICSFKNGIVVYQYLKRTGGGKYIERSGNICNRNGHMGLYYTDVYKLDENGFTETFSAKYTERYESVGDEDYNVYREYFIDEAPVSEAEYNNAVGAAFDFSKAISFNENAVSYNQIMSQLNPSYSVG